MNSTLIKLLLKIKKKIVKIQSTITYFMSSTDSFEEGIEEKKSKLDFVQVCRAVAKPNTGLNDMIIKARGSDCWSEYILGKRSEERLPTPWSDLSEEDVEYYTRKFYRDFYFRFPYIVKRILRIRSVEELIRYAKVGTRWLLCNKK